MTRETDFYDRMVDDTTASPVIVTGTALMSILTGGVYVAGLVGQEGINRDTTTGAFSSGYLLPCSLVRQRGLIPDLEIMELGEQLASVTQVVEIYLYEDTGYSSIDAALNRLYFLFHGHRFSDGGIVEWINTIDRLRDEGALAGRSLARMDFIVRSIRS